MQFALRGVINEHTQVCPSPKALAKIKARIKQLTARERTPIPLDDIVGSMNAIRREWTNFFYYGNSSNVMKKVRTRAEERLRTHLMKRHKVKDPGNRLGALPQSTALYALWVIQGSDNSGLEISACLV